MTTATKITFVRVLLLPVFLACMYLAKPYPFMLYVALGVFVIASLTDLIDGKVARKYHQESDFGKFLDPLADKVLVIAAMAVFCEWGVFPAWALMIVLTREFAVTGLRLIAVGKGRVIAAAWSGKMKTALTMAGLCLMLFFNGEYFADLLNTYICPDFMTVFNWVIVGVITAVTLYSGVEYFVKNRDVFQNEKP